ncbi:MAG: OmpH family outer membrane protein [Bacteroidales bacterium]|nr:OmpH family outer membrane protein [Bacteroidales bacterium]
MTEIGEQNQKKTNVSLIVSLVVSLGLIVLYILFFTQKNEPVKMEKKPGEIQTIASTSAGTIAFVNTDEILSNYELVKKLSGQLDKERNKKDNDLKQRQKEYESEAAYFQESVQNQSISEKSAQMIYEQLMVKQQEILELQETYAAELAQKEYEINIMLLDSIRNYLDRMNTDNRFDYILNYNLSGSILLAKDTFDISGPVIKGLNSEYNAKYSPE